MYWYRIVKIDKRKIIQLASAILYNSNFSGFKNAKIYQGSIKNLCVPGLNCYSCPGAIASCPLGSFQNYIVNRKGLSGLINRFPFYILGLIILFGVVFGRVVCGFLCPFGFIQELIYKIKSPKIKKNNLTRKFTITKYIILFLFAILFPIILGNPSFCKFICPAGTIEAGVILVSFNKSLQNSIGFLFNWKVFVASIIIIMSLFMYRFFCRFICPLGAIYSFFNRTAIFRIKINEKTCTHCNACINTCLMDVKKVGDRECIECGECIKKCPENALYRFSKIS